MGIIMKHLIYITAIFLILGIWLTSCRSPQPSVKTDTTVKMAGIKDEVKSDKDSMSLVLEKKINKVYERINSLNIEVRQLKTDYSTPDSTGKQYPTSTMETKVKVNSNTTEKTMMNERVSLQLNEIKSSLDSIKSTLNYLIEQNVQTKPSLTWWQKTKQNISIFALGIFIAGMLVIMGWFAYRWREKRSGDNQSEKN